MSAWILVIMSRMLIVAVASAGIIFKARRMTIIALIVSGMSGGMAYE